MMKGRGTDSKLASVVRSGVKGKDMCCKPCKGGTKSGGGKK